jgi:hypothetical protein
MLGVLTSPRRRRPLVEAYAGPQFVGIDLHRRRSVIVRITAAGAVLETTRIVNGADRLAVVLRRAGESPEVVLEATYGWYWAAQPERNTVLQVEAFKGTLSRLTERLPVQLVKPIFVPPRGPKYRFRCTTMIGFYKHLREEVPQTAYKPPGHRWRRSECHPKLVDNRQQLIDGCFVNLLRQPQRGENPGHEAIKIRL